MRGFCIAVCLKDKLTYLAGMKGVIIIVIVIVIIIVLVIVIVIIVPRQSEVSGVRSQHLNMQERGNPRGVTRDLITTAQWYLGGVRGQ